ncbi:hypothetical protein M0802_000329 [Mischocyttarus mexicanus]|nr:hypothetical protein M0802_000329 [Mischocyttarus mexicanus]
MCEDTAVGDTLLGHDLLPTSATTLMRGEALVSGRTIRFVASSKSHKTQRQPSPSPSPSPPPSRVTNPLLAFVGDTEIVVVQEKE